MGIGEFKVMQNHLLELTTFQESVVIIPFLPSSLQNSLPPNGEVL